MKISWPQINGTGSRSGVSQLRTDLNMFARIAERSADFKTSLMLHLQALIGALPGIAAAILSNAQAVTWQTNAGVATGGGTGIVTTAGVITAIRANTATYPMSSGVKFLGPAVTGTYVNGYTATIASGVITAIVAS